MAFTNKITAEDKKITELVKLLNEAYSGTEKIVVHRVHKWLRANGLIDNKKSKNAGKYRHVTKSGKDAGLKNVSIHNGSEYIFVFTKAGCDYMLKRVEEIAKFEE